MSAVSPRRVSAVVSAAAVALLSSPKDRFMSRLAFACLAIVSFAFGAARQLPAQMLPIVTVAGGTQPADRQLIITSAELGLDKDQPPRLWILGQDQPLALTGDDKNPQRWTVNLPAALCQKLRDSLTIVYVEYGTMLAGPIGVPIDDLHPVVYASDLKLTQLPAAIHGTLTGDQTHSATFIGKRGERVQVEIEARRLGGKLRPVIHLYDARRVQLAYAQTMRPAGGDARLSFVLPSDGEYRVEWHDALYKGEAPGTYRVKLGVFRNVERLFPLVMSTADLQSAFPEPLALLTGASELVRLDSKALEKGPRAWRSAKQALTEVPQDIEPTLQLEPQTEIRLPPGETPPSAIFSAPIGLNGILAKAGEEDRFTVIVESGKTYRFATLAALADSPVDGVLTLYDAAGNKQLMTADDAPKSQDPVLEYTVPKDVKELTVGIRDLLGRGGLEYAYNIEVTEAKTPNVVAAWEDNVLYTTAGSRQISRVKVKRQNLPGELKLVVGNNSETIAAESKEHLLLIPSRSERRESFSLSGKIQSDKLPDGASVIRSEGSFNQTPTSFTTLPIVQSDRVTPITLDWSSDPAQLPRGGELALPVKLTRTDKAKGPVRLSLLTNQPAQTKTVKENNQDKTVPATEKMLRLAGTTEIGADALEGSVTLQVPSDLAQDKYQLALRGELLSLDGKRVLAVTHTTIATPKTVYPLQLELSNDIDPKQPHDVRAGTGATVEFKGKIKRTLGTATPVRVTLEGWPMGWPAPLADLSADQTEFTLPLRLPFKESKAAFKDVKLVAVAQPMPGPQAGGLRSPSLPLLLKAVPGEKPVQKNSHVLFDEEDDFPAKLNTGAGNGEASLDNQSATRGKVALKFSPPMRGQPNLPEWNFKIRQHPGSGEYRYLRFTWKKPRGQRQPFVPVSRRIRQHARCLINNCRQPPRAEITRDRARSLCGLRRVHAYGLWRRAWRQHASRVLRRDHIGSNAGRSGVISALDNMESLPMFELSRFAGEHEGLSNSESGAREFGCRKLPFKAMPEASSLA
jgi:hypothetical protein